MSAVGKRGRSLEAALSKVAPAELEAFKAAPAPELEKATRKKLVAVTMYVSADDHQRLSDLSHFSKTSLQKLGIEAWNLLLISRGHPPLQPTSADRPSGRTRA